MLLFKLADEFESKIDQDPPLEYGSEEYWELAEGLVSSLDQDKFNWEVDKALKNEIAQEGLEYLPDVLQLSIDGEDAGIWIHYLDYYTPAKEIKSLSIPEGVSEEDLETYVNNIMESSDEYADLIAADHNGKQVLFVRVGEQDNRGKFKRTNSNVIPVFLSSEQVLKVSRFLDLELKSFGQDEGPPTVPSFEGARTMEELSEMYPEEAPLTEREPTQQIRTGLDFNNRELMLLRRGLLHLLSTGELNEDEIHEVSRLMTKVTADLSMDKSLEKELEFAI